MAGVTASIEGNLLTCLGSKLDVVTIVMPKPSAVAANSLANQIAGCCHGVLPKLTVSPLTVDIGSQHSGANSTNNGYHPKHPEH